MLHEYYNCVYLCPRVASFICTYTVWCLSQRETVAISFPEPGARFNIKMSSYRYRKSHCGDTTVVRSSYLHNGISYTGKMSSLYWIGALITKHMTTRLRLFRFANSRKELRFKQYQLYSNCCTCLCCTAVKYTPFLLQIVGLIYCIHELVLICNS